MGNKARYELLKKCIDGGDDSACHAEYYDNIEDAEGRLSILEGYDEQLNLFIDDEGGFLERAQTRSERSTLVHARKQTLSRQDLINLDNELVNQFNR